MSRQLCLEIAIGKMSIVAIVHLKLHSVSFLNADICLEIIGRYNIYDMPNIGRYDTQRYIPLPHTLPITKMVLFTSVTCEVQLYTR